MNPLPSARCCPTFVYQKASPWTSVLRSYQIAAPIRIASPTIAIATSAIPNCFEARVDPAFDASVIATIGCPTVVVAVPLAATRLDGVTASAPGRAPSSSPTPAHSPKRLAPP